MMTIEMAMQYQVRTKRGESSGRAVRYTAAVGLDRSSNEARGTLAITTAQPRPGRYRWYELGSAILPRALQEAMIALDFASVGKRVVQFSDLPIRSLMLHRGGDYMRSVAPAWVSALIDADARAKGSLVRTLQVLADADMNVLKAGRKLGIHPNTIYARLDRIKVLTGLDGQRHHHLVELLLAADCWQA
jgi:sugar diacid utilization regulator